MHAVARLILGTLMLAVAAPALAEVSAHDRLFQLFKDSDEAYLQRNPLQAMYRGDYRYADRIGDLYSDAHYQAEKAAAERELSAPTTSSPTTCSNSRRTTRCARFSRTCCR